MDQHPLEALKAMLMGLTAEPWVVDVRGSGGPAPRAEASPDEIAEAVRKHQRRNGLA